MNNEKDMRDNLISDDELDAATGGYNNPRNRGKGGSAGITKDMTLFEIKYLYPTVVDRICSLGLDIKSKSDDYLLAVNVEKAANICGYDTSFYVDCLNL